MAKFFGEVGYGQTEENPAGSGVWVDVITEKSYFGDVVRNSRTALSGDKINDDLSVSNSISVLADPYAYENIFAIRYVRWMGALWKVSEAEIQSPRLVLRLGGIYNGPKA